MAEPMDTIAYSVDKEHVLTGACRLTLATEEMGLTTEDGVTFGDEKTWTEVKGDQSLVTVKKRLAHVRRTITVTLQEIQLATLAAAGNYTLDGTTITYKHAPVEMALIIRGPAEHERTFTYTTTVLSIEIGDVVRSKSGAVGLPVTFEEVGNPDTNQFGTWSEA